MRACFAPTPLLVMIPLVGGLCPAMLGAAADPSAHGTPGSHMTFLDNGIIRLGVDLDRGGSIGYMADVKTGANVVNVHDPGRWIGQSYYSGPRPFGQPHPGWKDWPWNPVGAGDIYGHRGTVLAHANDGTSLYVKWAPLQWALNNVPGECTFETWITLNGTTARVRNRLTNGRSDRTQYPALDQELPAVYTTGKLHRLITYDGEKPFTGAPLRQVPLRPARGPIPAWSTFPATEHWAALVNDSDWGLGVVHPGVVRFLGGFSGTPDTGGPQDDPTGYISPVRTEVLDHNIVYEYESILILDSLPNIRKYACAHRPKTRLPDYRFDRDRQHWWYVHAEDTSSPTRTGLRVKLERDDPQMIGPDGSWDARDLGKLFIRAAYHTRQTTAEVFWRTRDDPTFSPDRRVTFPIIPDGRFHTYGVDLAGSPGFRGTITGFRFDPVPTGAAGDFVEIGSISFEKD